MRRNKPPRPSRRREPRCPHCKVQIGTPLGFGGKDHDTQPGDWVLCSACAGIILYDAAVQPVMPPMGFIAALKLSKPQDYEDLVDMLFIMAGGQ